MIGVQNTIVGPGVSLCCKCLSALVHIKPFSVRSRTLKLLRFEFCIHVTSSVSFWPENCKDSGNLCSCAFSLCQYSVVFRCVYEIIIDGSVDFDLHENAVSVSVLSLCD